MLSLLKIKNLALVDSLVWKLDRGLIGVTGETGAGKSVIVGALKLVLGERADKSLIRTGEVNCVVEAVFDLPNSPVVNAILEESGVDACEDGQLIVKRVIGQSSNKQFVNNCPATLSVLKSFSGSSRSSRSSRVALGRAAIIYAGCLCWSFRFIREI